MRTIALTIAALLLASPGPALVWEAYKHEQARRDHWYWMRRSTDVEDRRADPFTPMPDLARAHITIVKPIPRVDK
jgi:hypothetical protein